MRIKPHFLKEIAMPSFPILSLSAPKTKINEGNSGSTALKLTATLSEPATTPITFTATAKNGTATGGLDFQKYTKVLKIDKGQTEIEFSIQILGDTANEANETFSVELSKLSSKALFSNDLSTLPISLQIVDDDKPVARVADVKVAEGDNGIKEAVVTVTLNTAATSDVSMSYKTSDGIAKAELDYISDADVLVIPKGSKEGKIKIDVLGDTQPEASENFFVELSEISGALFVGGVDSLTSTVTITTDDDKLLPTLTVKAVGVDEGAEDEMTDYLVTFKLDAPSATEVSVTYATRDGVARDGSDYEGKTGTVIFLPGESEQTVNINVYGDSEIEEDEEFILYLSEPTNLKFADSQPTQEITLLIRDDDQGGDTAPQLLEGTPRNDKLDATENGGYGDDRLDGKAGSDTMIGGDGDDTYLVDNPKDVIIEEDQSEGAAGDDDLVRLTASTYALPANVEHVTVDGRGKANVTGNELNNRFTGNGAVNVFLGSDGNDTLDGGSGKDTMTGGEGEDIFIVSSGVKGSKNVDTITDFEAGVDKIYLSHEIFTKIADAAGFIEENEPLSVYDADIFLSGEKIKADSSSSYLLYDTKTGRVYYDADGNGKGAADWFLTLVGKPNLTADDFYIA
jgi:Ca2+-binding RTX toxin-like protein